MSPEPACQTHLATSLPPGLIGALPIIQGRKQAGPSEPPVIFEGTPRQKPWSRDHAPQAISSSCPSKPHSPWIRPASLLWPKPNPRSALRGALPKRPGVPTLEIGDRKAPVPALPSLQAATRVMRRPNHSGQENGQGPPCQGHHSKVPRDKSLWPMLPLPSTLTSARPSAHHSSLVRACWPTGD